MVDTSVLEPGTVIAGRYRVASKIGHGGMGAVYLVNHVHTDESLALKVVHAQVLRDAEAIERFRREARAPARITSEHVARVTDADTAPELDGAPFYVMEFLRGRDLERILAEDGPLPAPMAVEYLRQMARALDKAHAIGIIHRDLKPENLFLTHREDGTPCIKLLDFGIARLADKETPGPQVTQVGVVFGTPNYMAPEQSLGDNDKIGPATDVWALGLLAFKLLVGQEFFTGKANAQIYAQILSEPLPTPTARGSSHGPAFDAWFSRCVARPIGERFASAGEAVAALAVALGVSLIERHSSATFPVALSALRASHPSHGAIATAPYSGQAQPPVASPVAQPGGMTALPTELPAGLPRPPARRGLMLAIAGGAVALIGLVVLVVALRKPAHAESSVGIVASPSASTSAVTEPPLAEPSASAPEAASAAATPKAPSGGSEPRSRPTSPKNPAKNSEPATLSRDQRKRLEALDRLCSQGTYTPAECQSKRQAIIHGGT